MAIEAKFDFLREVEQSISDSVTVAEMQKIMKSVNAILDGFEMRKINKWSDDKDDMLNSYINALSVECRSPKTIDPNKS